MKRTPLKRKTTLRSRTTLKTSVRGKSSPTRAKKTKRAKKMELKRILCEQYGLPIIPCSRWGTAKAPTRTGLLRGMLWHVFSAYIRKRDQWKPCITCNLPLDGNCQAGHYVPVGDSSVSMWFREDNVHGEHPACNRDFNGWHLVPMRKNMVRLYGEEHVSEMDSYAGRKDAVKWEESDYVARIKHYLDKLNSHN